MVKTSELHSEQALLPVAIGIIAATLGSINFYFIGFRLEYRD